MIDKKKIKDREKIYPSHIYGIHINGYMENNTLNNQKHKTNIDDNIKLDSIQR